MSRTIVVCGYGPGISHATAERFGAEGFAVALVGRTAARLADGVKRLEARGVRAAAFAHDLGEPNHAGALASQIREQLGAISVIHWNAYSHAAGDLSTAAVAELRGGLDLAVSGLVALYQAALADLESQPDAAILITCGGLALDNPQVDAMAVKWSAMGLAIAKAAQHKLAAVLHHHLQPRGIFVGEVVVNALVKGTAFDAGNATLEPAAVAAAFWDLYRARTAATRMIS